MVLNLCYFFWTSAVEWVTRYEEVRAEHGGHAEHRAD